MPHSSGGGSSGGGFHSGSSSSSSSHSSSVRTYSSRPFPGATCYVYYTNTRPHLIYANQLPEASKGAVILSFIFSILLILFSIGFPIGFSYRHPSKIKTNYDTTIIIQDHNSVLGFEEMDLLNNKFLEFYTTTGITPSLITIDNNTANEYDSLVDCAFEYYINTFNDEKHWLFVYASDHNEMKTNWAFEGMQGDDTDSILYTYVTDEFNKTLYNELSKEDTTVAEAFINTFDQTTPHVMKQGFHFDWPIIVVGGAMLIFAIFFLVNQIININRSKNIKKAVPLKGSPALKVCPYCGNSYYAETVENCPKCGKAVEFPINPHLPTDTDVE